MRRRLVVCGSLMVAALAGSMPSLAQAQTGEFERITARVRAGWVNQDDGRTRFDELVIYNATPSTRVEVACRGTGCGFSTAREVAVGRSGILRLSGLRGLRRPVRPGAVLETTITVPHGSKVVTYRAVRRGDPVITRSCAFEDALPAACTAPCPPPPGVTGDYCATAGQVLARGSDAIRYDWMGRGRNVVFLDMVLKNLPRRATIGVFCFGPDCPFGASFQSASGKTARIVGDLRRRPLRPGTVVEVRVLLGNALATVRRLAIGRGHHIRMTTNCLYPAESAPRACPPVARSAARAALSGRRAHP
jgi:hypothetical protein